MTFSFTAGNYWIDSRWFKESVLVVAGGRMASGLGRPKTIPYKRCLLRRQERTRQLHRRLGGL